jgi:hypothetical protein
MSIDWSKAPEATTGAMQADFKHTEGGFGHVEFLPSHSCRNEYSEGPGAWIYHEKPKPWDGKGLPPAGTVCELRNVSAGTDWSEATVVFASRNVVVWDWAGEPAINGLCTAYGHAVEMRPIRTAEQIAAEERDKAIKEMTARTEHGGLKSWAEYVYDHLGYRKQEITQ